MEQRNHNNRAVVYKGMTVRTVNGSFVSQDEHLTAAHPTDHQSGALLSGEIHRPATTRWLAVGSVTSGRRLVAIGQVAISIHAPGKF